MLNSVDKRDYDHLINKVWDSSIDLLAYVQSDPTTPVEFKYSFQARRTIAVHCRYLEQPRLASHFEYDSTWRGVYEINKYVQRTLIYGFLDMPHLGLSRYGVLFAGATWYSAPEGEVNKLADNVIKLSEAISQLWSLVQERGAASAPECY